MKYLHQGYAIGSIGLAIFRNLIIFWPQFFYSPPDGKGTIYMPAAMVGIAMFIAKSLDIVTDPIVGDMSDRTDSPWGKRLPYIVIGLPVWLLATFLLFTPPIAGNSMLNFVYLIVVASIFFVSSTAVQIPYFSLLPEITNAEEQRVGLSVTMGRYYLIGVIVAAAGSPILVSHFGFKSMVSLLLIMAAIPLFLSMLAIHRSKPNYQPVQRRNLFANMWSLIRQKPCYTFLAGHLLFSFGYFTILVALPFLITEILGLDIKAMGVFIMLTMVISIMLAPVVRKLSLRFGKIFTIRIALLFFVLIFCAWFFIDKIAWLDQTMVTPSIGGMHLSGGEQIPLSAFIEMFVIFMVLGFPIAVHLLLPNAICAELVDLDQKEVGYRREAFVYGALNGLDKISIMLASLVAPLLLQFGNSTANPDGIYLIGPVAAVFALIGYFILRRCPMR